MLKRNILTPRNRSQNIKECSRGRVNRGISLITRSFAVRELANTSRLNHKSAMEKAWSLTVTDKVTSGTKSFLFALCGRLYSPFYNANMCSAVRGAPSYCECTGGLRPVRIIPYRCLLTHRTARWYRRKITLKRWQFLLRPNLLVQMKARETELYTKLELHRCHFHNTVIT